MKQLNCILSILFLAFSTFASPPDTGFFVDLATPTRKWEFTTYAGNTPAIPVQIFTNGSAYTGLSAYTCQLNYGINDAASSLKTISGTIVGSVATFQAVSNSFPAKGDYFGEIFFISGSSKITAGQGVLHVQRSPSSGSYGDLNLSPRVNWDLVVNIGTVPWSLLTEPIFLASVAYNITPPMTNQWSVAFTNYGPRITSNEANIAILTTGKIDLATSLSSNATIQAQVSINTTGKTDLATYNAHVAAQAATNLAFQSLHTAQGNTNLAYQALHTAQAASNVNFQAQITANGTNDTPLATYNAHVLAQANTNAAFQALHNAQVNSNAGYQVALSAQVNTNAGFQANYTNQANTNLAFQALHTAQGATNAAFEPRIQNGETAYGWDNHANYGYLTATTNIFTDIYAANRANLGTNIAGLTQATYTGVITTVSYTGVTVMVYGNTYAWGFTKANAFGTSTLSIASQSLTRTTAGTSTNHFTYLSTDTNLILRLDGDGSSKSDVTGVYLKRITNGNVNVANDLNIGGKMYLDGAVMTNPAVHIAATGTNVHGLGTIALKSTNDYTNTVTLAAAAYPASNPSNWVSTSVTNAIHAQVTNEIAVRTASNATIQAQVAILNTNTAPLQSYLSTSNALGIVLTNYFPLQSGLSGSNDLAIIKTNYTTIPIFTAHTNNSGANILHLTTAEKAIATNAPTLVEVLTRSNDAGSGSISNLLILDFGSGWQIRNNLGYLLIENTNGLQLEFDPTTPKFKFNEPIYVDDNVVLTNVAYGTSDATAYRGDWGASVSNTVTSNTTWKVGTNDASYLSILRSMTNYVAVASATNYLAYDPATRLLTGCVTNSGGGLASDWSAYPAMQTVAMASNILDNVSALRLSQFGQLHEKLETKNIIVQGNTLSRLGQYTSLTMTNPPSGTPMNFLVLSALSRTNIFLNDPEDFDNCLVLSRASQDGRNYVGINEAPASQGEATTAYALTVKGGTRLDTANVGTLTTTNLQVTGGATNGGILYSTNAAGQLGMLGGLLANRKLFVNEAGTAPEYATGVATAELIISATNVSTTTAFVTLGFRPSSVLFLASNQEFLTQGSVGFSSAAGNAYCLYNEAGTTVGNWSIAGSIPMYLFASVGNSFYGLISSTATNGFTLTFTRTGTPTGSVRIAMLGFR